MTEDDQTVEKQSSISRGNIKLKKQKLEEDTINITAVCLLSVMYFLVYPIQYQDIKCYILSGSSILFYF